MMLDELAPRDWSRALVQAIESRPDPMLAPAVARWTEGMLRSDVAAAASVIRSCQAATPWPVLRPGSMAPPPLAQLLARIETTWGPDQERDQVLTLSPTPGALVEHVGADPSLRQRAVDHLLRHLPEPLSSSPDLAPLLDQCLDAGREVKPLLLLLAGHRSAAVRRRLFDRLWPIAQSRTLPASWTDVTPADLMPALVQVTPSPDLLAVLLDVASGRDWDHSLIGAILKRPTPHLVPALERWSAAHPTRQEQLRVQAALDACRRAGPWSSARPSPLSVPSLPLPRRD